MNSGLSDDRWARKICKIAFQGEHGAYSEEAILEHYGPGTATTPCESFDLVFAAVQSGECSHGFIPVENSLAGSIHRNYDLLLKHDLVVVGEHYLRVSHCLIGLPGARIENLRRVISHPQALAQCEHNLRGLAGVTRRAGLRYGRQRQDDQGNWRSDRGGCGIAPRG